MPKPLRCSGTYRVPAWACSPLVFRQSSHEKGAPLGELLLHWSLMKKIGPAQKECFPFKTIFSWKWDQVPPWTPVCPSPFPFLLAFFCSILTTQSYFLIFFPLQSHTANTLAEVLLLQTWYCTEEWSIDLSGMAQDQLLLLQGYAGWISQLSLLVGLKHPSFPPASSSQPGCAWRHILAGPRTPFATTGQGWPGTSCSWQITIAATLTWRSQFWRFPCVWRQHAQSQDGQGAVDGEGITGDQQGHSWHSNTSLCFQETAPFCRARDLNWLSKTVSQKHFKSRLITNFIHSLYKAKLLCRIP